MKNIVWYIGIIWCTISANSIHTSSGITALLAPSGSVASTVSSTPKQSDISALLGKPAALPASTGALSNTQDGLLDMFVTMQSNPWYIKAMTILSDPEFAVVYHNALFSMQLFFLQSAAQDLSTTHAQGSVPLSSLIRKALLSSPAGKNHTGALGLASLLSSAQGVVTQRLSSAAQQQSIASVLTEIKAPASTAQFIHKPDPTGLQNLLDAVASPLAHSTTNSVAGLSATNNIVSTLAAS